MHTVHLGFGSNLGDRQANILQALQQLRKWATIDAVSAFYETPAAGGVAGPAFLNAAAAVRTDLEPRAFDAALRKAERALGWQQPGAPLGARPIDIDILLWGELTADFGHFALPHPYLAERPYNLVPLAEIAPAVVVPPGGQRVDVLAARYAGSGIVRVRRALHFFADRQDEAPEVRLSINRVGVSSVKRLVRLKIGGRERVFNGEFTMVADLPPDKAGVHMSRFSELLEEAILDVLARGERLGRIEDAAARVAREIVDSQKALRADVRLRAEFALERWTPVSGKRGEETYALVTIAHADASGSRRVVGVEADGMTACPCAQLMVREHSLGELMDAGFCETDAVRALDALPVATHNQRGRGTILIGTRDGHESEIDAEDLVEIVESSMSSETYGLLKRPDEFFVVNKAHHNPKFVEDVVRGIMSRALEVYADFPGDTFVLASQINYESIHKHDAFAEAFGTFDQLRQELRTGRYEGRKTDLAGWLGTQASVAVG